MRHWSERGVMLLLVFVGAGCALSDSPQGFSVFSHFIINGEPDTDPAHEGVVALVTPTDFMFCSGAVIEPRFVITEAHCVEQSNPADVLVSIGPDAATGTRLSVDEIFIHPDHDPGSDTEPSVHDLALLRLSEPVAANVTPLKILPEEMKITEADIGTAVTFVGYGRTENNTIGTRLKVGGILGWMCTTQGGCNQGPVRVSENSICFNMHDAGTCNGDSGGPAFIMRGGTEYIAGLTSYGDTDCSLFGCDTKVDEYHDWIDSVVFGTLGSACSADGDCDSGNCKDGVCCVPECTSQCYSCAIPGSFGDCVQLPDGQPCPDGNPCNGQEVCESGVCQPGGMKDCDDSNPCTVDTCDNVTGCVHEPEPDGTICDDSDLCVGVGKCSSGYCQFQSANECDDHNECTDDICKPDTGCRFEPLADGTDCNGGACGKAACIGGECTVTDPIDCDDGNSCTKDFCDPGVGCMAEQKDDGTPCGECGVCVSGECDPGPACKSSCGCSQDAPGSSFPLFGLLLVFMVRAKRRGKEGEGRERMR